MGPTAQRKARMMPSRRASAGSFLNLARCSANIAPPAQELQVLDPYCAQILGSFKATAELFREYSIFWLARGFSPTGHVV